MKTKKQKLLIDDYLEELGKHTTTLSPGTTGYQFPVSIYQPGTAWGGTGNYGFGDRKQIVNQKLNNATEKMADYEFNSLVADQRDDESFEDDYAEEQIEKQKEKFNDFGSVFQEQYPQQLAARGGTNSSFANLPGWPAMNTLSKRVNHIPDDKAGTESEELKHRAEDYADHVGDQHQKYGNIDKQAKLIAAKSKAVNNRIPSTPTKNKNTPSNMGAVGKVTNPKQFVPKELDQYTTNQDNDLFVTISRYDSR